MKPIEKTIETVWERKREYEAQAKLRRAKRIKMIAGISCVCLLLSAFVGGTAVIKNLFAPEDYRILLDINPSIEISVDRNNHVKEIHGLNEDGDQILEELSLKGEETPDALRSVILEVVEQGYISEEANSVLVSIESADEQRSEALKEEIANGISQTLNEKSLDGAIIVQVIAPDDEALSEQADAYGISAGKAQLIHQILEQNKFHTFEELAVMSIHELNLLRVSYYVSMEGSYEAGSPAQLAYIGSQRAQEIAMTDANASVRESEAMLECLNGAMLYRVEFETTTHQYRYRINAVTGEILSAEEISFGNDSFFVGDEAVATVGENAALLAAISHAGMEDRTLIRCKQRGDWVDGTSIYHIFFTDGIQSGRYVVNARTGEILQYSLTQEYHDRSIQETVIGHLEAKRIALAEDGLIDGNVSKYEMNLKAEGEGYVYTLEYICNATRYTVRMNAVDGSILSFEKLVLKDTATPPVEDGTDASVEG